MHGLNTYDYGARQYNPVTARWDRMDPLCEKYYNISPYTYCVNNPVKLVDPKGEEPTDAEAALISKHVYGGDDADEAQRKLNASGWKVCTKYDFLKLCSDSKEGFKSQLYERTKTGKIEFCYAFAGADDSKDARDDFDQFFGNTPEQYQMAVANAEVLSFALKQDYGLDVDFSFTGHSLGGGEAAAASMATGHKAQTFNPAAVVSLGLLGNASYVTNYIATSIPLGVSMLGGRLYTTSIGGDIVTAAQALFGVKAPGTSINVYTSYCAGHGIDNFFNYYYPTKK